MRLAVVSVNQRLLSGPSVIWLGPAACVVVPNSVNVPLVKLYDVMLLGLKSVTYRLLSAPTAMPVGFAARFVMGISCVTLGGLEVGLGGGVEPMTVPFPQPARAAASTAAAKPIETLTRIPLPWGRTPGGVRKLRPIRRTGGCSRRSKAAVKSRDAPVAPFHGGRIYA